MSTGVFPQRLTFGDGARVFPAMSLRNRLLTAISVALLVSFSAAAVLAVWQARQIVEAEQQAGLYSGRQAMVAALAGLPPDGQDGEELARIVGAFDGNRHVRAELLGPGGEVLASSHPAVSSVTPAWLVAVIVPPLPPLLLPVRSRGDGRRLLLVSDPMNEAAERWSELRIRMAGFAFFFVTASALCGLITARSLHPLTSLAHGMAQLGRGEVSPSLPDSGPAELAAVARAFNGLADSLRRAETRNRTLERQIAMIVEEERAEIARDLHDEVGPLLFAINAYAAAIRHHVHMGEIEPVDGQLDAIRQSVARLQLHVRDILGRLLPGAPAPVGLAEALDRLVAFWRGIRPQTRFTLEVAASLDLLPDAARDCLLRAAQEGVSNAVRHGDPDTVAVAVSREGRQIVLRVRDDGRGGAEHAGGLGLAGMRARAASLGGTVAVHAGAGWDLAVTLPDLPQHAS